MVQNRDRPVSFCVFCAARSINRNFFELRRLFKALSEGFFVFFKYGPRVIGSVTARFSIRP